MTDIGDDVTKYPTNFLKIKEKIAQFFFWVFRLALDNRK